MDEMPIRLDDWTNSGEASVFLYYIMKEDCQVSYIFVWMYLSVCFTDEFLSKYDLFKGLKCRCNPSIHPNWNKEWQWLVSHSQVSKPGFRN
jgi:hypothetical protein